MPCKKRLALRDLPRARRKVAQQVDGVRTAQRATFGQPFYHLSKSNEFIFEQCTGLKDKNGKLVYEGDFFRPSFAKEEEKVFGIITFGKYDDFSKILGFYVKWKGYPAEETEHGYKGWRKDLIFWLERGEIEIIGNIHENAVLLEGSHETNNSF